MNTAEKALSEMKAHQMGCEQRYKEIERRLEEGSEKFKRIEHSVLGIYPFVLACIVIAVWLK